jgi:hypothetical protein
MWHTQRNEYNISVEKLVEKSLLRNGSKDNIKMDLKEIG